MLRTDVMELPRDGAVSVVDRAVPYLTALRDEVAPGAYLEALLAASSALCETARGTLAFPHPVIRAVFGAEFLTTWGELPLVIAHAHRPDWAEIVRFVGLSQCHRAAGRARPVVPASPLAWHNSAAGAVLRRRPGVDRAAAGLDVR